MRYYEGLQCPVCHKGFSDTDDMVVCPQCGLPHHRNCWNTIGACAAEKDHNTPNQWSRDQAQAEATKGYVPPQGEPQNSQICPHCYTRNGEFSEFCSHCGRHLKATDWHSGQPMNEEPPVAQYTPFRMGDVNPEVYSASERIGDFSAADMAAMVGSNTRYYIPRFRRMAQNGSGGWNFCAFLFGPYWLLIRKMFVPGILLFVMQTVLSLATVILYEPLFNAVSESDVLSATEQIMQNPLFIPVAVLSLFLFAIRIVLGLRGNEYYKLVCEKKIIKAREKTPDISSAELTSAGGISIGITVLFYFVSYLLTDVFSYFFL